MTISIRQVTGDKDDLLLALQKTILPSDYPLQPDGENEWWIAWDGTEAVAFAAMSPSKSAPEKFGYLSRAGVLRSHRGLGLQKRLIRVRLNAARRAGWSHVVTDTASWNAASINSLTACGFRAYRPENPWMAKGACYWRRPL